MNDELFETLTIALSVFAGVLLVVIVCLICYYCQMAEDAANSKAIQQKRIQQNRARAKTINRQREASIPPSPTPRTRSVVRQESQGQNLVTRSRSVVITEVYGDPNALLKKKDSKRKKSHTRCDSCHKRKVSKHKLSTHEARHVQLGTPVNRVQTTLCRAPDPKSSQESLSQGINIGPIIVNTPTSVNERGVQPKTVTFKRSRSLRSRPSTIDANTQVNLTQPDGHHLHTSNLSRNSSPTFTQGASPDDSPTALPNSSPTFPPSQNSYRVNREGPSQYLPVFNDTQEVETHPHDNVEVSIDAI